MAPCGAEILVDAGVYTDPLFITKPVTIRSTAQNPDEFVPIDHAAGEGGLKWADIRVIFVHAVYVELKSSSSIESVRIVGFRIICEATIDVSVQAVTVFGCVAVLRSCAISCSSGPALCVLSPGGHLIAEDCSIYDGA